MALWKPHYIQIKLVLKILEEYKIKYFGRLKQTEYIIRNNDFFVLFIN